MYEQLLRALQEFRLHSMECCTDLMEVAYARPMPAPNKEVYIRTEVSWFVEFFEILKILICFCVLHIDGNDKM